MRNVTYRILNAVGAVGVKGCTKEEYAVAPEELKTKANEYDADVYQLYTELDENDAKLYLMAKQTKDIHTIRNILLTYFVLSIAAAVIFVLQIL